MTAERFAFLALNSAMEEAKGGKLRLNAGPFAPTFYGEMDTLVTFDIPEDGVEHDWTGNYEIKNLSAIVKKSGTVGWYSIHNKDNDVVIKGSCDTIDSPVQIDSKNLIESGLCNIRCVKILISQIFF